MFITCCMFTLNEEIHASVIFCAFYIFLLSLTIVKTMAFYSLKNPCKERTCFCNFFQGFFNIKYSKNHQLFCKSVFYISKIKHAKIFMIIIFSFTTVQIMLLLSLSPLGPLCNTRRQFEVIQHVQKYIEHYHSCDVHSCFNHVI